jgi:hypothetical protein
MDNLQFKVLKHPLNTNQFYLQAQQKQYIFLHHTAGSDAQSAIEWWNSKPDHIATPYIIDRDGSTYENFDPKFWSFALGVKGGTYIEKAAIHIEIVSQGLLTKRQSTGEFLANGTVIKPEEVLSMDNIYRGSKYFHKYTDEQIASLQALLQYLIPKFNIPVDQDWDTFYQLQNFECAATSSYKKLKPGIWSHTSVRADKSDIFPQANLISMLKAITGSLANSNNTGNGINL